MKPIIEPLYIYRATITRVVDGDTFEADVDLGFHTRVRQSFRMAGINAPEIFRAAPEVRAAGMASRDWLLDQIEGQDVLIATLKDKTEKWRRYLAVVFPADTPVIECTFERSLNREMLRLKLATPA